METSQIYQEQKFGQRSPQKHQVEKSINQISYQELETLKLVEIIPKTQICYEKIVLTDSYAVLLTFHTFTIQFGNFIRNLNFEETTQLMHLESIDMIAKYICENLQINKNENININIGQHQEQFQKYSIPSTPTIVYSEDLGMIDIQYPRLSAYFQDSAQSEDIYLTNSDVLHLIGNKFCTIQQYCQRINFGKQRTYIRQFHNLRIKEVGIDIYDQSTLKQLQIKQAKCLIDLNKKCLKQVCEIDSNYVILTLQFLHCENKIQINYKKYKQYFKINNSFILKITKFSFISNMLIFQSRTIHPPQLILKQLKKTIFRHNFTLLEFLQLCYMLQKVQLETFLIMIKLQKQDGKYRFVYDLNEFPLSNELSQSCLRNGLQAKINKSIKHDLHYFKLEYVPFKIIIYDPLEVKESEMPIDFNLLEQIIIHKLNVEFKIY